MGLKQSIYEKDVFRYYYKLTPEECVSTKNVWVEVESNLQHHGNIFFLNFLETYPQYVKYFTLNPRLPLSIDVRINAKFTAIMEAIGYLLLDFLTKPKQLDHLVGYIAMVHKDMRLNRQDMIYFEEKFLQFLVQTFPKQMSGQSERTITKYFRSIVNGILSKMEYFQNYEISVVIGDPFSTLSRFGRCTFCINNLIFGQTLHYWNERKKNWEALLDEWEAKSASELIAGSSTDEEEVSASKSKADSNEIKTASKRKQKSLPMQPSGNNEKHFPLILHRKVEKDDRANPESQTLHRRNKKSKEKNLVRMQVQQGVRNHSLRIGGATPRERFRARSIAREIINPYNDPTILRRRLRSSRVAVRPSSSFLHQWTRDNIGSAQSNGKEPRRFGNTARERRRESQQYDLK